MLNVSYNDSFFVKIKQQFHRVRTKEIDWIQIQGKYSTFYTVSFPSGFSLRVSSPKIKEYLNPENFVQIHRNYIVNIAKIKIYDPSGKVVIDNQELPVSKSYRKILEDKLNFLA